MLKNISQKIISRWISKEYINPIYSECYLYGLEICLQSLIGFVQVIILSIFLGSIITAISFLITFVILRCYTGGYHAKTYKKCHLYLNIVYIICYFLSTQTYINNTILLGTTLIIGLPTIIFLCPMQHSNKILDNSQKKKNKIISLLLYILGNILSILLKNKYTIVSKSISITMLEVICLLIINIITEERGNNEIRRKNSK